MKISGIIWLEDILYKIQHKHHVLQHEVVEALANKPYFHFVEKGHQKDEDVYSALGRTDDGRYLIVFFVYKQDKKALILSAREMSSKERKCYEKK